MLNQYLTDWSALCSSIIKAALADALSYIASLRKNAFKGSSFMRFSFPPGKTCCRCTVVFSRAACHTVEEWDLRGIPFQMGNHKAPKQAQVAALANCHLARAESIIISRIMGRGDSQHWNLGLTKWSEKNMLHISYSNAFSWLLMSGFPHNQSVLTLTGYRTIQWESYESIAQN